MEGTFERGFVQIEGEKGHVRQLPKHALQCFNFITHFDEIVGAAEVPFVVNFLHPFHGNIIT